MDSVVFHTVNMGTKLLDHQLNIVKATDSGARKQKQSVFQVSIKIHWLYSL